MPVPSKMADLYTIASSNSPSGSEAIGNSLDDYLRSLSAILRSTNALSSATLTSASTVNLGASDAEHVQITGTATISSFGTSVTGLVRECRFTSALTISASTNIVTPNGQDLAVAAGDIVTFRSMGSGVWRAVSSCGVPLLRDGSLSISEVSGLQSALNAKASLSGANFTGNVSTTRVVVNTAGEAGVELNSAQGGRQARVIQSASGSIGFYSEDGWLIAITPDNNVSIPGALAAASFTGPVVAAAVADVNATQANNLNVYTYTGAASNIPPDGGFGGVLTIGRTANSGTQLSMRETAASGSQRMWFRGFSGGTFASWVEVYHSGNQPRVFVQSSDPGSQPDGTLWVW